MSGRSVADVYFAARLNFQTHFFSGDIDQVILLTSALMRFSVFQMMTACSSIIHGAKGFGKTNPICLALDDAIIQIYAPWLRSSGIYVLRVLCKWIFPRAFCFAPLIFRGRWLSRRKIGLSITSDMVYSKTSG